MSESPDAEHMETLKQMGFDEERSRQALIGSKNDLNEAIALLTDSEESETISSKDVEHMNTKTLHGSDDNRGSPPALLPEKDMESHDVQNIRPPTYEEAVTGSEVSPSNAASSTSAGEGGLQEFPLTNLYELEGRVFTESWSIPFKRNESLGKCLLASVNLAKHGQWSFFSFVLVCAIDCHKSPPYVMTSWLLYM